MNTFTELILALFGGIFGAYIGGFNAFILCGLFGLIGVAVFMATGDASFLNNIASGPVFAKHVSFIGGTAAAAYWGKKSRNDLINDNLKMKGTDLYTPLSKKENLEVLLIGGVFGLVGQAINLFFDNLNWLAADTGALAVVLAGMLIRLIFTDVGLSGKNFSFEKRFKDLRLKAIISKAIPAYAIAVLMASLVEITKVSSVGYYLGAFSIIFIAMGLDMPMLQHIGMVAGFAYLAFNNIWLAGIFGITAFILAEVLDRIFNTNADSYMDTITFSIFIHSVLLLNI